MNEKYINQQITPKLEILPLDQVNCFSRVFTLCFSSFNIKFMDLYLMLDSFYNCYRIATQNNFKSYFEKELELSKIFGIDISKVYTSDDFYELIENNVSHGFPIITVVNLKYIYYSDYYLESDWEHPLIIKGYDKTKKIFYILDNLQLKKDSDCERDFVIEYEALYKAYLSYFEDIVKTDNTFILVFKIKSEEEMKLNCVVHNSLNYIKHNILNIFETKKYDEIFGNTKNKKILNIYKYKKLFFDKYLNLVYQLGVIDYELHKILMKKREYLIKIWEKYNYKSYIYYSKNGVYPLINSLYSELIDKEIELWKLLNLNSHIDFKFSFLEKDSYKGAIVENNDNLLILYDKNVIFNFNREKIYNTWLGDDSPKIMYSKSTTFEFWTSVEILENFENADFVAGIVIRNTNHIYYYGLDSQKRINLDLKGEISSIKEKMVSLTYVELGVKFCNGKCYFMYKKESNIYNFYCMDFDVLELEYGIGCKTYFYPKPLKIQMEILYNQK